jgi:isoquinoline 1-oxidoreductase beta subunit
MDNVNISRRSFLKSGALLGGGLLISFAVPAKVRGLLANIDEVADNFVPNAFLKINADNTVHVLLAHSEMGQGIWTSLPMIIADELDADWNDIKVEHAPASPEYKHTLFGVQITGGSSTTFSEFDRYRTAGATAKTLLLAAGAKKMGVDIAACKTEQGYVISGAKRFSYGELVTEAAKLNPPDKITLKSPADWKFIGHSTKRLDGLQKINGTALFGMDMKGDGLLIAAVVHSPVIGGTVKSYDDSEAMSVPGVVAIVEISTGIAVIASNYYSADKAKKLVKVTYNENKNDQFDTRVQAESYKKLLISDGLPGLKKGTASMQAFKAWKTVESEYTFPYLTHAPMEPLNATVKISDDKMHCEIWTGTQMPMNEQAAAAKILGIPVENVKVHTTFLGGGFGRRATPQSDWVSEAVEIAKVSGRYIKMIWAREDDIKGQHYRPQFAHKVKVALNEKGMPEFWHHNVAGQSIYQENGFVNLVKDGVDESSIEGISDSHYLGSIPNVFIGAHATKAPITILWWRAVGHSHTAFVMETMIDQLAHAAGKDPVDYRRNLLKESPRSLAALNLAAEKAEWGKPLPKGHFHGVAVHASFRSHVAEIVEISLDPTNQLVVHKVTCAIDCGLNINPENIKAQMESCIIFGMTMAKYGELTITKGKVDQSNFYDYKVVRMNETPVMDIHLVPYTGQALGGVGEAGLPPLAPALANALFQATGKHIRTLPLMNHILKPAKS